jgi:tetratricopeptide (TPR) repeat protein
LVTASGSFACSQGVDDEALRHFRAAQTAQNSRSLDVAADEYLQVIRLRPETAEAYASLGLVYSAQGSYEQSARTLLKAEKLKPGLPGVSFYIGVDYARLQRAALAIPYLSEAVRIEPKNREAHTWLCRALWEDGQISKALTKLDETSNLFPSDAPLLLDLGEAYRKAADRTVQSVLSASKGKPLLHQIYGDIYKDEHSWDKAMAHYERALSEDPHWPGAHFALGEIALAAQRVDDAAREYHLELQINPNSAASLARLAEVQLLKGDVDEAITLLHSANHLSPEATWNALGLPRTYPDTYMPLDEQLQNKLRESMALLEGKQASAEKNLALTVAHALLSKDGDAPVAPEWATSGSSAKLKEPPDLFKKSVASYNRHDFKAAASDLNKWHKLHPLDLEADYLLARSYRNLSYATLERLLTIAPTSYSAHQLLGETYEYAGKDDQALAEYRIVAASAPDLPGVHYSVGHLLMRMGQDQEALAELIEELRLNPSNAEANAAVGSILLARSEQANAVPYMEKAIQLNPDLSETRRQLGKAYYLQKDFKKAEDVLRVALKDDPQGLAHYQLGLVYRDLGDKIAAQEQFAISRKAKLDSLSDAENRMTTVENLNR